MSAALIELALGWWSWMGPMLWQSSVLVLLIALLDRSIRRWAWPQLRLALWLLVVLKLVLPPSLSSPWSVSSSWMDAAPFEATLQGLVPPIHGAHSASTALGSDASGRGREADSDAHDPASLIPVVLLLVWMTGVVSLASRELVRVRALRRGLLAERQSQRLPEHLIARLDDVARRLRLGRLPRVFVTRSCAGPAVFGCWRPWLLLPAELLDPACSQELEHVLLHELAHVKRRDLVQGALVRAIEIVYWFNPLVGWARRRLSELRELCCDATVAELLQERTFEYRRSLLLASRRLLAQPRVRFEQAGFLHAPGILIQRLRWLERPTWKFGLRQRATVACAFASLSICVLPMSAEIALRERDAQPASPARIVPLATVQLDDARASVLRVAQGGGRESCLRLHYAAMLLAQADREPRTTP